jgi:hypothetical protein
MTKRPLAIFFTSLLFLYFPAELAARYHDHMQISGGEVLLSGILPIVVLYGLLRVTKLGWISLVGFVALWGLNDLYMFYLIRGAHLTTLITHLAIYGLSLSYFINPRIRTLYFDPKLCWWKSKPRFETNLPAIINDGKNWHYPILRNVSEGGCFVETPHLLEMNSALALTIPLPIPLNVPVIHSQGVVRWVSRNPLRTGMGIEFNGETAAQRKAIRQYVRQQL